MGKLTKEGVIAELLKYREQGVIILGPQDRRGNKLRVYANGGVLGKIGITKKAQCEIHKKPDYLEHLEKKEEKEALLKLIDESKKKGVNARHVSEILCDKHYIDYMLKATKQWDTRYDKCTGQKVRGERSIETSLIAQQGKIENKNNNLLVYDMEYEITLPSIKAIRKGKEVPKKSEPDLIVFDGKNIGIIELKYNADSMTGKNGLKEHYLDFMDFIWNGTDKGRWDIIDESIYRLECLKDAGLIDDSWYDNITELREWYKSNEAGNFDTDRIWIGFYFVEGPNKQGKKYVENEIRRQLEGVMRDAKNNYHHTRVRYGYWPDDKEIKLILDKKIEVNDAGKIELNRLDE